MHRPKHLVEYAALRVIGATSNALPQAAALSLGRVYASIGCRVLRKMRLSAEDRIRQVFGEEMRADEVRKVATKAFHDLTFHLIEILRTPQVTPDWVEENAFIEPEDRRRFENALAHRKGVIIAVPHLANWDLAGVGLQQLGYPMTFIVRKQKNPLFDDYLNQLRGHLGSTVIERDDPMLLRKVLRALKKGSVVAVLVDLRSKQPDLKLPFLGQDADLSRGVGVMSHLAGCPVVPAYATRAPDGRHQWHFEDSVMPDRKANRNEDSERILREVLPPIEAAIRSRPEQYFWFNKRWVLEPIG